MNKEIPTSKFSLKQIDTLSPKDAKKYIDKYFYPLETGEHAFINNGKIDIFEESVIKKTYFNRMSKDLSNYYFKEKKELISLTYDINKPMIYDECLNLCPKIKQTYKKYSEFSKDIKKKVDFILKHILEVYCSDNQECYDFLLKWFANMIKGNRNNSALYLKGPQGCGKSSIVDDFFRFHVIGEDLTYQGGSDPLKSRFNGSLSGKLMVLFEELETFSTAEWSGVSVILKRQITSKTIQIERKGKETRDETNLNNYILLSNNDAIKDDNGRRYFILPISTKYLGNNDYFTKLHSYFTDEIGQAFYSYLLEIDLTDYNPQHFPITQSKLDSYSKRLDNVYQFIKDVYILNSKGLERVSLSELYLQYQNYTNGIKAKCKIEFNNTLKNVGINCYKSNSKHVFKISLEELKTIAEKFKWIHELDLDEPDSEDEEN